MTSPFVRRRRLAAELRTLRERKGMTADRLAKLIHQSRMKISRLENAHGRPDLAEVMKILDLLERQRRQVAGGRPHRPRRRRTRLVGLLRRRDGRPAAPLRRHRVRRENHPRIHQTAMPGVLQTPEFTWALVELPGPKGRSTISPSAWPRRGSSVSEPILRPGGPAYEIILDEIVIRRFSVPPEMMSAQLHHIINPAKSQPR